MTREMKVKVKYYVSDCGRAYAHVWIDQAPGTMDLFRVDDDEELIEIVAPYEEGYDLDDPSIVSSCDIHGKNWQEVVAKVKALVAGLQAIAKHYYTMEIMIPENKEFIITAESITEKPLKE